MMRKIFIILFSVFILISCSEDEPEILSVAIFDNNDGYALQGDLLVAQYEVAGLGSEYYVVVRWLRNGAPIYGAHSEIYQLTDSDIPSKITFEVAIVDTRSDNIYFNGSDEYFNGNQVASNAISTGSAPVLSGMVQYLDINGNAAVDNEDQLILSFDQEINVNNIQVTDFVLPVEGDSLGIASTVVSGPSENEITITLGLSSHLTIQNEFNGAVIENSPSAIDLNENILPDVVTSVSGVSTSSSMPKDIIASFVDSFQDYDGIYNYINVTSSYDVAVGDFDADSDLDLIFASTSGTHIVFNDGQGHFEISDTSTLNGSVTVAAGDLDEDGDLDLIVKQTIYFNEGNGSFTQSLQSLSTEDAFLDSITLGDVDGDGDLDAVTTESTGIHVYTNNGQGNFQDSGQLLGTYYAGNDTALGDIDGDGDLDLVVANWFGESNKIYFNNSNGIYTDSSQLLGTSNSTSVALGDIDIDGDLDAIFANDFGEPNSIFLNNGKGSFIQSKQQLGNSFSDSVAIGDIDNDGDLDLVFANARELIWNGGDSIYLNDGEGFFGEAVFKLDNYESSAVVLGDVDKDGDLDIIVTNMHDRNRVYLNSLPAN